MVIMNISRLFMPSLPVRHKTHPLIILARLFSLTAMWFNRMIVITISELVDHGNGWYSEVTHYHQTDRAAIPFPFIMSLPPLWKMCARECVNGLKSFTISVVQLLWKSSFCLIRSLISKRQIFLANMSEVSLSVIFQVHFVHSTCSQRSFWCDIFA